MLDAPPADVPAAPAKPRGRKRTIALLLVMATVIVGVYLSPLRAWLRDPGRVRGAVGALGAWVYPVGTLVIAVAVACGIPRLLLCTVAGLTLGFWRGLLLGEAGTLLGYYAVFAFVRWGGHDWALHRWPKLRKWSDLIQGQGAIAVILLRLLPVHGTFTNLGLGLSRVKHRHFLIGTAIGVIPESVPATLVGTGLVKGSTKVIAGYLTLAAVAFALIWLGCGYAIKALRASRAGKGLLAEAAALKALEE